MDILKANILIYVMPKAENALWGRSPHFQTLNSETSKAMRGLVAASQGGGHPSFLREPAPGADTLVQLTGCVRVKLLIFRKKATPGKGLSLHLLAQSKAAWDQLHANPVTQPNPASQL